jgi:prevent-host-death family protein
MISIGAYEAKTHLSKLLEKVARGETVMITKHGDPVALLKPARGRRKKPVGDVIEELKKFRSKHSLKGLTIKQMIEEDRG